MQGAKKSKLFKHERGNKSLNFVSEFFDFSLVFKFSGFAVGTLIFFVTFFYQEKKLTGYNRLQNCIL